MEAVVQALNLVFALALIAGAILLLRRSWVPVTNRLFPKLRLKRAQRASWASAAYQTDPESLHPDDPH